MSAAGAQGWKPLTIVLAALVALVADSRDGSDFLLGGLLGSEGPKSGHVALGVYGAATRARRGFVTACSHHQLSPQMCRDGSSQLSSIQGLGYRGEK